MSDVNGSSRRVPMTATNGARFSGRKLRSGERVPSASSAPPGLALLLGRVLFVGALLVSVAMRGAVSPVTLLLTVLLVSLALFLGALAPPVEPRTLRSYRLCMAVATLLVLFLLLQAWSVSGNPFAHPLWSRVDRLLGGEVAAVSVSPAATRDAAFTLVAPFLFYSAGLALFQRDEGGLLLMRWLAALGIAFAVFGLLQIGLFPDRLLLVAKTAYLDSLTSTFVNRNTAGTFLGVSGFAILTLALSPVSDRRGAASLLAVLSDPGAPVRRRLWAAVILLGLFAVFLALFLTRSRGALLATAVAVTVVFVVFALHGSGRRWRRRAGARLDAMGRGRRIALALSVPVVVLLVVAVFGGLAIQRMEARGVDEVRLCVYWSTLSAIGQNWTFGTGFGTFQSTFPLYRSPDCGAARDMFLRAHNTYLEGMLGLGILFVPLVLGGLVHVLRNLYQGVLRRRRMRAVSIAAIGAVILVALHALVDFSLQIPGMAAFFAAYLAAATTVSLARSGTSPAARSQHPPPAQP